MKLIVENAELILMDENMVCRFKRNRAGANRLIHMVHYEISARTAKDACGEKDLMKIIEDTVRSLK